MIPETHKVEGKNGLLQIFLCPPPSAVAYKLPPNTSTPSKYIKIE